MSPGKRKGEGEGEIEEATVYWRYAGEEGKVKESREIESLPRYAEEEDAAAHRDDVMALEEKKKARQQRQEEEENANRTTKEEAEPVTADEQLNLDNKPEDDIMAGEDMKDGDIHSENDIQTATNIESFVEQPELLEQIDPAKLYYDLIDSGYEVKPLGKGNFAGISFEQGGGYRVNWGGDRILQYHPTSRSHHGGAYFKISSGRTGTIRIYK